MSENTAPKQNSPGKPYKCMTCGSPEYHAYQRSNSKTPIRICKPCKKACSDKRYARSRRRRKGAGAQSPAAIKRRIISEQAWRTTLRAALIRLAGGKCVKCGYGANSAALQFDHVDPATKKFCINYVGMPCNRLEGRKLRLAEFKKCQLLCATCHMEKTHPRFQKEIQLPEYVPWGL